LNVGVGVLLGVLLVGCENSVSPIVENDQHFSVHGLLDAARDTQVVRVEPLRDSVAIGAPREIDASVTLTNLDTDATVTLRDSFATVNGEFKAHLFWAPMQVQPGNRYRVRVVDSDGNASVASATIPERPPQIIVPAATEAICDLDVGGRAEIERTFNVVLRGVDNVAGVRAGYRAYGGWYSYPHSSQLVARSNGSFGGVVEYEDDLEQIGGPRGCDACPCRSDFDEERIYVIAASSGPEGPPFAGLSDRVVARPDTVDNVEQGTGFVGGIYSDTTTVALRFGDG
jgi:hypothetical protein